MIEEALVSTFILGGLYALMAIGFSLIQGVSRIMNLAHGAFYMLAGYFIYSLLFLGLGTAIVVSLILIVFTSFIVYKILIGPLREKEARAALVTLALALILQESVKLIWGPEVKNIPSVITGNVTILGVTVTSQRLLAAITAILLVAVLMVFIRRTKSGKAIRAVAQNMEVARLVGINISKVMIITMGISALLAGFTAVLFTPVYLLAPTEWMILFRSFPTIILGGLGSLKGSLAAAFILAGIEKGIEFTIGGGHIVPTVTFAVMIIILFVRPSGLFGQSTK